MPPINRGNLMATLTAAEAKKQLKNLKPVYEFDAKGFDSITLDAADELAKWPGAGFIFNDLKELSADLAERLAACKGDSLQLNGLTQLSADAAEKLSKWKGNGNGRFLSLYLNGLTSLDAATAGKLAKWAGSNLYLEGLTALDSVTAGNLSKRPGENLMLHGLTSTTPETAAQLASWKRTKDWQTGSLYLGLTSLSSEVAEKLIAYDGARLSFPRLAVLAVVAAEKLVQWPPRAQSKSLSVHRSYSFDALVSLDAATAQALASWKGGTLSFGSVKSLEVTAAEKLFTAGVSNLHLGIEALEKSIAEKIALWGGSLDLENVKVLDTATAKALASFQGKQLSLYGLESAPPEAVRALQKAKDKIEFSSSLLQRNDNEEEPSAPQPPAPKAKITPMKKAAKKPTTKKPALKKSASKKPTTKKRTR
jgi:hypothetical protein